MQDPARGCALLNDVSLLEPERLVGLGFRYWMLGRMSGDVTAWEQAWHLYSGVFGLTGGQVALGQLSSWVGALGRAGQRKIVVQPRSYSGFCHDECVAISMIAACQHRTCPALRACAFALVECSLIDEVVEQAQGFADTLLNLDQVLMPSSIVVAPAAIASACQLPN